MQVQAIPGDVRLEDGCAVPAQDPESEVPGKHPGARSTCPLTRSQLVPCPKGKLGVCSLLPHLLKVSSVSTFGFFIQHLYVALALWELSM